MIQDNLHIGDIYWIKKDSEIPHPHVVIEIIDEVTLLCCAITTNMRKLSLPGNVLLEDGEGGLEKQSIVDVAKEVRVDIADLGTYIGTLSYERVAQIKNGIGFLKRSFF